ncbi:DNA-directed RNA polymerase 7 kDa subunit, partial [Monkeypox virus]
VQPLLDIN